MKKIIIALFAVLALTSLFAQNAVWMDNYDAALKLSAQKKIPVLINFTGSDWCYWCKKLDKEVFSQPDFAKYSKSSLILLKVDFPKNIKQTDDVKAFNKELANKFNIEGFPTIVLIDSKGKEINRTGYQEGGAATYVKHLKSLLKK
jgi:protein disulfide-isomerase